MQGVVVLETLGGDKDRVMLNHGNVTSHKTLAGFMATSGCGPLLDNCYFL